MADRIVSEALMSQMSQTSKFTFPTESFWGSMWFVSFDGLCNYLDLFWRQPGIGFLRIATATFFNRKALAIKQTYLVKQNLTYSSNTFKGHFMRIFAAVKAALVYYKMLTNNSLIAQHNFITQDIYGKDSNLTYFTKCWGFAPPSLPYFNC